MYTPEKGDLIWLDFNPSSGHEIMKRRPAYVISRALFNKHTGFAIVAPITSKPRGMKLEVILEGLNTQGSVLIHQIKSVDFRHRNATFIEKSPLKLVTQVTNLALTIIR